MTNLYLDDKRHDHMTINDCLSECCGAVTNSDIMICSDCGEHCEIYYEDDEEPENENKN